MVSRLDSVWHSHPSHNTSTTVPVRRVLTTLQIPRSSVSPSDSLTAASTRLPSVISVLGAHLDQLRHRYRLFPR